MNKGTHSHNHTQGKPHISLTGTPNSDVSPFLLERDWTSVPYTHDSNKNERGSSVHIAQIDENSLSYVIDRPYFKGNSDRATIRIGDRL